MKNNSFNDWLPECEAELRENTHRLYRKHNGKSLGIEANDLANEVFAKLAARNHPVSDRNQLFGLMKIVTLNLIRDIRRKKIFRDQFIAQPPPTWEESSPENWVETLAHNWASPFEQVALRDDIDSIVKALEQDHQLALLFETITDLVGRGEQPSVVNIAGHLDLPYKQVTKSLGKLRSVAEKISA